MSSSLSLYGMFGTDPSPRVPTQRPFHHPFDLTFYPHPLTRRKTSYLPQFSSREHTIRRISSSIRDRVAWVEDITDLDSFKKLLLLPNDDNKSISGGMLVAPSDGINDGEIEFLFEELVGYKAYVVELRKKGVLIEPGVDGVWKQDGLLDESSRGRLKEAASTLSSLPASSRNWPTLPDTPEKDLLDPTIYPIIYDETLSRNQTHYQKVTAVTLPSLECRQVHGVSIAEQEEIQKLGLDTFFSWLPSEFEVSPSTGATKIVSYINNLTLPGQDVIFHPLLEKVFSGTVKAFNHVLADLDRRVYNIKKRDDDAERFMHKWSSPVISKNRSLEGKTVKVVVRMVQIDLDPKKVRYMYAGGEWRVEGMANERIVATSIYQYSQENVTDCCIQFRLKSFYIDDYQFKPTRGDTEFVGSMKLSENRAITYPNTFESRFSDFSLKDKTKSGHIKLLIFHLCDPFGHEIPSTRTIRPQQPEQFENLLRTTRLGIFPEEIYQEITQDEWGNIITEEEVGEYRKLMVEHRNGIFKKKVKRTSNSRVRRKE
ncbi:hypothetical protein TWF569_010110 [Orbilia oligospora]|uniref:DUF4246 domain-containing protein n=1 Tax=Orbilia oligospora TaxID=2813651 RepID=A0A7C8NG48_ORBOL|nr:hypothetical protein TWF102_000634 [Orbilia oligospora]KAF3112364.1 hypothetical protein TWF103_003154 [Orbilia oligospora]KAF3134530.1 hypothetical protein TWF569_010110 [Orbilia oligospora]KAF3136000.1 hypothetical protein TWF594_007975 [Orbilia oligospora]